MRLLIASVIAAACCGSAAAAPLPDYPGPGPHRKIHWVGYEMYVPAIDKATGLPIPGLRFHVFVSASGARRYVPEMVPIQ